MAQQHPSWQRLVAYARQHGSRAQTAKGLMRYARGSARAYASPPKSHTRRDVRVPSCLDFSKHRAWQRCPLHPRMYQWGRDWQAAAVELSQTHPERYRAHERVNVHGRKRVRTEPGTVPKDEERDLQQYARYSGPFEYVGLYASALYVSPSGKIAVYVVGEEARVLPAPSGLSWRVDGEGACLVARDGTEWHPLYEDLTASAFASHARSCLAASRRRRRAARSRTRRAIHWVTRETLRGVGACEAGIRSAEKKLARKYGWCGQVGAVSIDLLEKHYPQWASLCRGQ